MTCLQCHSFHKAMPLSFVHTADFHLGADLRRFGVTAASRLMEAQLQALDQVMALSTERKADFVVICGDLFDSRSPAEKTVRSALRVIGSYRSMPVYVLPGTHDFLSENSVLTSIDNYAPPDNLIILTDANSSPLHLPEKNVWLYFGVNRSNKSSSSPIAGCVRKKEEGYHIGLAHGSLTLGGIDTSYDFPVTMKDIENSELDYLALGHWHNLQTGKQGRTTFAYAGTPQPLGFSDPEEGKVLFVTLRDLMEPDIEPIKSSRVNFRVLSEKIYHPHQVTQLLNKAGDADTIVKLDFAYSDNFKEVREANRAINEAKARFLLLLSDEPVDRSPLPESVHQDLSDGNLLEETFLAELQRMSVSDSPERAHLYKRAASLGLQIIRREI